MTAVWLMEPKALERRLDARRELMPRADSMALSRGSGARSSVSRGVGRVHLRGALIPELALIDVVLDEVLGIGATSTRDAASLIDRFAADPEVRAIELHVDSPGGTVDGTASLGESVRRASAQKPVITIAPDLMASAALWVGAQASEVSIGPTAAIGSIGAYLVVPDTSAMAEQLGIKMHVISSAELKGAGVAGSKITEAQLAAWQAEIDKITKLFVDAVAIGRGMTVEAARALATGGVWIGAEAVSAGLADAVVSRPIAAAKSSRKASADPQAGIRSEIRSLERALNSIPLYANASSYGARADMARRRQIGGRLDSLRAKLPALPQPPQPAAARPITKGPTMISDNDNWHDLAPHVRMEREAEATDKIERLTSEQMAKGLSLTEAIARVKAENPDLARFMG